MSNLNNWNEGYDRLNQMSTEELREILRQDSCRTDSDNTDMDYILQIMEVLVLREKCSADEQQNTIDEAWQRFQTHYCPTACDHFEESDCAVQFLPEDAPSNDYAKRKPHRRLLVRHFLVAAIIVCLLGTATASAFSVNLLQIVAQWTQDFFQLGGDPTERVSFAEEGELPQENTSLSDALADADISTDVVPTWLPDGFKETSSTVTAFPNRTLFYSIFKDGTREFSMTVTHYATLSDNLYRICEKDRSSVKLYEHSKIKHYVLSNLEQSTASWYNGNCECCIAGQLTEDEVIQMISSIYEGD